MWCPMSGVYERQCVYVGEGTLAPPTKFQLSDWGIELGTRPGAVLLFDSTHIKHQSPPPVNTDARHVPRMACALSVPDKVGLWFALTVQRHVHLQDDVQTFYTGSQAGAPDD